MRIIPVLDLRAGRAVHARAGDRAHYRPLVSRLHPEPDPIGLARAYRDVLGLSEVYLADLDAIAGGRPDLDRFRALNGLGLRSWADVGIRDRTSPLAELQAAGVARIVVGLETVDGPEGLAGILDDVGSDRVAFSLDLRDGRPLVAPGADWGTGDPLALAEAALGLGIRRLILLDLGRVGTGRGTGTRELLERLAGTDPNLELIVGGGVAGPDDLAMLADAGASAVLVGSALHDGRIGPGDLRDYRVPFDGDGLPEVSSR